MSVFKMNDRTAQTLAAACAGLATLAACGPIQTRNEVVIKQEQVIQVNVNLHADINVVITDARRDMQRIKGQQPVRKVSPADIGLDADTTLPAGPTSSAGTAIEPDQPVVTLAAFSVPAARPVARDDDIKAAMASRNAQIRALLDTRNAGEAHTGLLEKRGALTAEQQKLMEAENKDREELYKIEAQRKGITVDKVALGYYLARLEYAKKGDWYERFNKQTKAWEWAQWNQ